MKLHTMLTSRPFITFFILLAPILLPSVLITFPVLKINDVKKEVDLITKNSHEQTWSVIQNAATALLPTNSSATRLAKLATASLIGKTDVTFFDIEAKVAPLLFQAMLMIPRVSQISYIRQDGLFFALCFDKHQIFAVYSNSSFSKAANDRKVYSWYTQPVDLDSGKLHKDAVVFPNRLLIKETWVQEALNATQESTSLGKSWINDSDNLLVLSATKNGVISIGFGLKSLMDAFTGIIPSGAGFYLATKDGKVLRNGIPNTRMVLDGNSTISFHILKENRDQSEKNQGSTTLQLNYTTRKSYNLDVSGTKYILYSSPIDIIGMPMVYVLALPYEGLQSKMHKNIVLSFVLLSLMLVSIAIYVFIFVVSMARAARKEMCVRSALIKQKEATQEAERKSNNQSLALVNASHDIRAQLAGITGLLEIMLTNDVDHGLELATNLRLMQICSQDLHGIVNRILDTSKIEAGKMQLQEKRFDLVKVLEDVVDLFYPVGMKGGVDVILDLQFGSLSKFCQVEGDDGMLKRILSNLLNNAIKFTSEGYVSVHVAARKPQLQNSTFASSSTQNQCTRCFFFNKNDDLEANDEVPSDPNCMEFVFEVNDTGKGIPKEKQASVFDNYVQVKETAGEVEGTGLGLGIVRSMVRLMGGEISIVNKEVGEKGTCFRFNVVFKVCASDLSEEDMPNSLFRSPKRHDYKSSTVVLFISGDARRKTTKRFLRAHGVKVLAVKNIGRLSETLRDSRQEPKSVCSSSSDSSISLRYLMGLTWRTSPQALHTRPNKRPLSAMDGSDVSPTRRTRQESVSEFLLLVIDTTRADFYEVCKAVAEFRKDSKNACSRVVWLGSRCIQLQGLDEKKLPPSDIIIPMPLHGSRLYSLIDLLPEFGGKFPNTPPYKNHHHHDRHHIPTRSREEISRISGSSSSPLRGKRVLVIEDDFVQQTITKRILLKQGMTVEMCKNGQDALMMVLKGLCDQRNLGASHILPYEYILMDYQMPVMDGCEATREIRLMEKDFGVHIPIIGLTALAGGEEEVNKLLTAGIDIHVSKPLNEHKVLKAIEDLHCRK